MSEYTLSRAFRYDEPPSATLINGFRYDARESYYLPAGFKYMDGVVSISRLNMEVLSPNTPDSPVALQPRRFMWIIT